MIAALPLSVSAAGEYVPGNPRWSGYQNQVQWGRPAGAASGDSFEYEAQLLLGDDVVESKAVEIDTYLFFTNDVVTRPQEEYTIRVRARWIMIVGDPDGQYMVADVGEAEPPHEHSYGIFAGQEDIFWYCPDCGGYFLDKDGEIETDEAGIIGEKAIGHAWGEPVWSWSDDGKTAEVTFTCKNDSSHVEKPEVTITQEEKTPATCTEAGTTTYTAKVTFNGQEYTSFKDVDDIDPLGHKAEKVDGDAPTATEPGNIEYWYCPQCDTYFKDADLTEVITKEQTVLAPTGEAEPSKPEETPSALTDPPQDKPDKTDDTTESPQTGDSSNLALWIGLMLASCGVLGMLFYRRKKAAAGK